MTPNPTKGMGQKPVDLIASGANSTLDVMWAAIRKLGTFTRNDLICHINKTHRVNDYTVKSYIKRLIKGHYLAVKTISKARGCQREHTYELVKDVGLDAPRLCKDGSPSQQGPLCQDSCRL